MMWPCSLLNSVHFGMLLSLAALFFFFWQSLLNDSTWLPKREGTRDGCPVFGSSNLGSPQPNLFFCLLLGKPFYHHVCESTVWLTEPLHSCGHI